MSSIAEQFLSLLNCYVFSWFARTLDGFEMNLYILKPCDFFWLFGLNISNSIHFVGIYWYIRERVSQLRNNWLLVLLLCEHFGAKSLKELSPLECVDVILFTIPESQGEKEEEEEDDIPSDRKLPKSTLLSKISATTIKSVLEVLCDESVSEKIVSQFFSFMVPREWLSTLF